MSAVEVQVPTGDAGGETCASCGAPLAPDQRYCLACGQPCSPVRLAFLDVLQEEHDLAPARASGSSRGYPDTVDQAGLLGSLRRYSGLFSLLAVMLLAIVVGLLVGHWITQSGTPAGQVVTIKGLTLPATSTSAAAGSTTPTTGGAATTTGGAAATGKAAKTTGSVATKGKATTSGQSTAGAATKKATEAKESLAAPVKESAAEQSKLSNSSGKKHVEEVNKDDSGDTPIETG